jgi:hypothetical protein
MTGTTHTRLRTLALSVLTIAAFAASVTVARAEAPTRVTRTWGPIGGVTVTFSVPATYNDCTPSGLTDALTTTGIPANWRLLGQVNIGYIGPSGFVVTQSIPIDQTGNLNLQIQYPPHTQILANPAGNIEYHVEPQIEVYDENGLKVTWVGGDLVNAPGTLGPGGQDWDVFCLEAPPPPPPPTGLAGCTPGYWKQPQHFDSYAGTGVTPATSFNSIFTGYALADAIWYVALDGGGGPGLDGARKILRRAAAAAYLNAAKLNYGYSPAQVVAAVQNASASNDRATILALASALDTLNNRGCPLN